MLQGWSPVGPCQQSWEAPLSWEMVSVTRFGGFGQPIGWEHQPTRVGKRTTDSCAPDGRRQLERSSPVFLLHATGGMYIGFTWWIKEGLRQGSQYSGEGYHGINKPILAED